MRSFEPELWRMEAEAGVTTATIARLARENGLLFPPDPGAPEQSQLGGTIATNAGGPHAFKYGVTGDWVTGIEAVLAPGELVRAGGATRKDVAGYDLRALLTGSEGTLGVITAAWLRFVPAPEHRRALVAAYPDAAAGCAAVLRVLASGIVPAALEFFDEGAIRAAGAAFPDGDLQGFVVWSPRRTAHATEAARVCEELHEALAPGARGLHAPESARAIWRWRDGRLARRDRRALRPSCSEDIAVPVDRLEEAIAATVRIGARHDLDACSWGHAGDGNLHASFLLDPGDDAQRARAGDAAQELFDLALTPRRHRHRRARHRRAEGRPALTPMGAGRRRRSAGDQGRPRPEGPLQPRQEAALSTRAWGRGERAALGPLSAQRRTHLRCSPARRPA